MMGMEAGGICTGWLGIGGSVEQLVCIISDVLDYKWIQGRPDVSDWEILTADDH